MNDRSMADSWKFGDVIENRAASADNPRRWGYLVRIGNRTGRVNSGRYAEMTDAMGKFWEASLAGQMLVRVAKSAIGPLGPPAQ